jgi:UDP:flavonoid glycosyltransferase YjiC (YdhE family)
LFIPVSGRFGMGEYARSLAIADGAAARWPGGALRFVLSRAAPYAARCPYPATLLESSPTFHSAAVSAVIEEWRPDVVIFDNAGRTAQLAAARRSGARVIYISARPRQRRKAFRLRWLSLIDEHWIAYPEFLAGSLGWLERLKLSLRPRVRVRYLDVMLTTARAPVPEGPTPRPRPAAGSYVLIVPGGGTGHPGARDAMAEFVAAARALAAGVDVIMVGRLPDAADAAGETAAGAPGAAAAAAPRLRLQGAMPQSELAGLMRGARLIIANGGSTLLQSIACGKACIAVPIAGDQRERIRRCEQAGVAIAAALDARSIEGAADGLLQNAAALEALAGRAKALGLVDGVPVALSALEALLAGRT